MDTSGPGAMCAGAARQLDALPVWAWKRLGIAHHQVSHLLPLRVGGGQ
jgi:hypothetical protein